MLSNAQNAGSAGKRTRPWVHRPQTPQFKMAVRVTPEHNVRTKCTRQNSSHARNRVVAYRGCLKHKPITARYLVLPGVCHRDWLCDGGWTLGMGQWDICIFLHRAPCLTHVRTWEFACTLISHGATIAPCISLQNVLRTACICVL